VSVCSGRQQQQHFGFPHSNIRKFLDKFWQPPSGKKRKAMAKIRTEVFIETSETFIIKRNRTFVRTWCEGCGREVRMVTLPEAALLTGYDVEAIYSMMENRHIHFRYLKSETPSVCLRSLCLI
jgi:hypothetical protein